MKATENTNLYKELSLTLLASIACLHLAAEPKALEDLKLEDFIGYDAIESVSMSRDGSYISYEKRNSKSESLHIVDLESGKETGFNIPERNDLSYASWAGTDNLMLYRQYFKNAESSLNRYDVKERKHRKNPHGINKGYYLIDYWDNNPDMIIYGRREDGELVIYHYNITENNPPEMITSTPPDTTGVMCDPDTGWPKIAITSKRSGYHYFMSEEDRGLEKTYYLESPDSEWEHLPYFDNDLSDYRKVYDSINPITIGPDGNTLYFGKESEHGTVGLYAYDLKNKKVIGEIASNPDFDLDYLSSGNPDDGYDYPFLFSDKRKALLGIRERSTYNTTLWIDPTFRQIQATLDKTLPKRRINNIYDWNWDETKFLVSSYSDTAFAEYYLFDLEKRKLDLFGKIKPDLPPEGLGKKMAMKIPLRDGSKILAYLRLPAGVDKAKNLPVICNIPSSMMKRWMWGNSAFYQLMASRGYATLQLHTRGRPGFGRAFFEKGFERNGEVIQEDLEDAIQYLIEKEIIDPDKIMLRANFWGAFFSLEAMSRHPDQFCGAILDRPYTDIDDYLDSTRRSRHRTERWNYFDLIKVLQKEAGDDQSTAFTLEKALDGIKAPVLAFGSKGVYVTYYSDQYAKELERELNKRNVPVTLMHINSGRTNYDHQRMETYREEIRTELEFTEEHMPLK